MTSETKENVRLLPSARFGTLLIWFYGAISMYLIRINFGVSIVCMTLDPVDNTTSHNDTSQNGTEAPPDDSCEAVSPDAEETGEFYWDRDTRGLLNSAFFLGYILTHIPGGILAQKFGPKWVHFGGMTIATAASMLSPVSAEGSEWGLLSCRILLGIGCGVFVPTVRNMINNWSPAYEKSIMASIQASGYSIGSMVAFSLSGLLCDTVGWEFTFYIPSLFVVVYLVLFGALGSDGPDKYRCVSEKERNYIMMNRSVQPAEHQPIPWKKIFTTMACISLFICDFCSAWGGYTTLTSGAQYMNDVLKFDIKTNGLYNALPALCKFVVSILGGILIDVIRRKHWLSNTNARKFAQSLGFMVPAAMMVGIGFMDCEHRGAAIAMLCIGEGISGFTRCGLLTIVMEVAPRYASVISGISSTCGTASGIICPIVAGFLTPNGTQGEWQKVFLIGAGIYTFGWIIFMIFADAEPQPWARSPADLDKNTTAEKELKFSKRQRESSLEDSRVTVLSYKDLGVTNKAAQVDD